MEFIRCWFCELARIAFTIEHLDDVQDALVYLEQDFSQRRNKADIAAIGSFVKEIGPLRNCRAASEEFAGLALRWLKKFDFLFPSRITNLCGCQIGGKTPRIDYNRLLKDLHEFYASFSTPVTDCEVNAFLGLGDAKGRAARTPDDPAIPKLAKSLSEYHQKKKWITCTECSRIGDTIIALEQPASWSLVHTDHSFNDLCRVLKKDHVQILSVGAIHSELRGILKPKPEL